jgi:hypothetical protein
MGCLLPQFPYESCKNFPAARMLPSISYETFTWLFLSPPPPEKTDFAAATLTFPITIMNEWYNNLQSFLNITASHGRR